MKANVKIYLAALLLSFFTGCKCQKKSSSDNDDKNPVSTSLPPSQSNGAGTPTSRWASGAPESNGVGVTFTAHLPANTPDGEVDLVIMSFYDYGDLLRIPMTRTEGTIATATTNLPAGGLIRYRYDRGGRATRERFDAQTPLAYRVVKVGSEARQIEDVLSRWEDLENTALKTGSISGTLTASDGTPLGDATVSISGVHTLTRVDGHYSLSGVPVGTQRITASTTLGDYHTADVESTVVEGAETTQDISLTPATKVTVTLSATPSDDFPTAGRLQVSGNIYQLGSTDYLENYLTPQQGLRSVLMTKDDTGAFSKTVDLYDGTYVEFAYTFGLELINQERDLADQSLIRYFVVSPDVTSYGDVLVRFHPEGYQTVTLNITDPSNIEVNDLLIDFESGGASFRAFPLGNHQWTYTFFLAGSETTLNYRYRREYAHEYLADGYRRVDLTAGSLTLTDTIDHFSFVDAPENIPDYSFTPVAVQSRSEFLGGVFPLDFWAPEFLPYIPPTLTRLDEAMPAAKWWTMTQIFDMESLNPPVFNRRNIRSGTVTMPQEDFKSAVSLIHGNGRKIFLNCSANPETIPGWGSSISLSDFFGPHDNAWYVNWMSEMDYLYLYAARAAAENNIEMIFLNQTDLFSFSDASTKASMNQWMIDTIAKIRSIAPHVKLVAERYNTSDWSWYSKADYIGFKIWKNLGVSDPTSVSAMKTAFDAYFASDIKPLSDATGGLPVIITQVAYPSVTGSGNEPSFLEPSKLDSSNFVFDPLAQAKVYDALMQSIAEKTWVHGLFSFGYAYGDLNSSKDLSIRGKPAEKVLDTYFGILGP